MEATEETTAKSYCKPNCVSEKDILDIAWNYFQQHAQQRLSFFNFFVIFSVLMTTGLISTFQEKYNAHSIGIAIGLMLSLISYVFWKIEERNKYLTKTGENAIKQIEQHYPCAKCYPDPVKFKIFSLEQEETDKIRKEQRGKIFVFRQISHSKSFNLIFFVFFVVGVLGAGASIYFQFYHPQSEQKIQQRKTDLEINDLKEDISKLVHEYTKLNTILIQILSSQTTQQLKENAPGRNVPAAPPSSSPP
ncbi:MAG: hypothetical protein CEE38_00720 [Planctomycetes bacterium B3_Pla]|nr:MAG: hypothetical protein CEE38_00720 [Planctomycetes bacterium B3_Pla]